MDRESLFKAFKIAIDKEYEAHSFYTDLAQKSTEQELKQIFERFASDELFHLNSLKKLYADMRENA